MEFLQVDVFSDGPYTGNPLAVFPDAGGLSGSQMQRIASEMNLSETAFVTSVEPHRYRVRIFTPRKELAFAGHPTIGTTWVLRNGGRLTEEDVTQVSDAGETSVTLEGDTLWFERIGSVGADIEEHDPLHREIARGLGVDQRDLGMEARELGRSGTLYPAVSNAGLEQLMVPVRDLAALARCSAAPGLLESAGIEGFYCFTATAAGRIQARGLFPAVGIAEDPATGSAAAALGLYLADRLGAIEVDVDQGVEMGRPSKIHVRGAPGRVKVGGRCSLVVSGRLEVLP
ncbi:MAG: PhzF family phenazine biosynthesis protein [Actinomycetota bacterium]|nr:PhzF family phenazine biosynthesis protein [Actinomycetota bacterium]